MDGGFNSLSRKEKVQTVTTTLLLVRAFCSLITVEKVSYSKHQRKFAPQMGFEGLSQNQFQSEADGAADPSQGYGFGSTQALQRALELNETKAKALIEQLDLGVSLEKAIREKDTHRLNLYRFPGLYCFLETIKQQRTNLAKAKAQSQPRFSKRQQRKQQRHPDLFQVKQIRDFKTAPQQDQF